jgi:hypothetical protein
MKKLVLLSTIALLLSACQQPTTETTPLNTITPITVAQTDTPSPSTQAPIPPPANCRQTALNPTEIMRAIHMGGNWGTNVESDNTPPSEYFEYLEELNVNWAGISVALHFDDSMDSTVERKYSDVIVPTFTDDFLRDMIRTYHQHGICVYLTLAFEPFEAEESDRPVYRWQLGGLTPLYDEGSILPEFWPWAIDHPDHERFVAEFWDTYTEQAVHFGQLAEEEGVGLYSLGTETEGLFRTRPSDEWPNDFSEELQTMVATVRQAYSGPLTYDLGFWILTEPEARGGAGSYHLWEDLELDIIGLSAYFPLADCPPLIAFPVETLEERWDRVFQDYLIPLQEENPDRPIVFTEFGYADSLSSVIIGSADSFTPRVVVDRDGNGLDDGEEMQANIHQAIFNVMGRYPGVVNGLFLWDLWMATDEQWTNEIDPFRGISIRGRLAEDIVRQYYGAEPRSTIPTPIPTTLDAPPQVFGETCEIYNDRFTIEWWNGYVWSAEVDTSSPRVVYSGERAIEVTLEPGGGLALGLTEMDISTYSWLVFYINGGEAPSQQIGIVMSLHGDWATPPLNVSDYVEGGQLLPGQWHKVVVPVRDLAPDSGIINQIQFIEAFGNPVATFYLDEIRFVVAEP